MEAVEKSNFQDLFFFFKKENHEANLVYFLNIPSSAVTPE